MSFDGTMLSYVTKELSETLEKGRINKIYQLSDFTFLFTIRRQKTHTLLISASRQSARIHLTGADYEKPMQPPMFCMFLRKHLEGARIEAIAQKDNDRIATFTIATTNELGDRVKLYLIFEALGKDANLILTDQDHKVLDCLHHTHPLETARTMIPSATYDYPEDDRVNPFDKDALENRLETTPISDHKDLLGNIQGISPLFAKEYLHRKSIDPRTSLHAMLHEAKFQILESDKLYFSYFDITHIRGARTLLETPSELLDHIFSKREYKERYKQQSKDLRTIITRETKKQQRKVEKLTRQLGKTEDADTLRKMGELLLSYQYSIEKGDRETTVHDYYDNLPITIPLDPEKTPVENANLYFEKFKKQKKSIPHLKRQLIRAKNELSYFRVLESQLDHGDLHDLAEIREELRDYGYVRQTQKTKKLSKKAKHLRFKDERGVTILVGKNNRQNAEITHKIADYNHVWFHVQNAPGSHVVAKERLKNLTETTIRTAAQLAAYYSKMRDSSSVAVDYTEVRNIKKIPGQKPCFVTYRNQKTIYIDPDPDFIAKLSENK